MERSENISSCQGKRNKCHKETRNDNEQICQQKNLSYTIAKITEIHC